MGREANTGEIDILTTQVNKEGRLRGKFRIYEMKLHPKDFNSWFDAILRICKAYLTVFLVIWFLGARFPGVSKKWLGYNDGLEAVIAYGCFAVIMFILSLIELNVNRKKAVTDIILAVCAIITLGFILPSTR